MNEPNQVCRYCNSIEIKTYKKIGKYVINYCKKCHLLFTTGSVADVTNSVNKEWYSEGYVSRYLKKSPDLKKRFAQKVLEIESIKNGGNLLDLGCGVGLFLESMTEAARFMWKLYGVDINQRLVKEAKARLGQKASSLYLGSLTTLSLKKDSFDCVTCFDVLEHDTQLESTLKETKKILKPSGLLLIQSPNQFSVMAYLCGALWDWWAVPDHIFHFTPRSLSFILQKQGFQIRKLYTWDPPEEFISNIQGSIKARLGTKSLIGRLISRCLYIPLLVLWGLLAIIERKFNIGSLLVILAEA